MSAQPDSRRQKRARLDFLMYRYRHLFRFAVIGLVSIELEILLIKSVLPTGWAWTAKAFAGFAAGLLFSFVLNSLVNFRVPRRQFLATFLPFCGISLFSFLLNMAAVTALRPLLGHEYGCARLVSASALFMIAYVLHRRYTFTSVRNFGLALYASENERVQAAFERVGPHLDHIHIDLVDETFRLDASPVNLSRIDEARRFWPAAPVCLHAMTKTPARWVEDTWSRVDWYLFHTNSTDDLMGLIYACRQRRKKVGVVWQRGVAPAEILPYLPHVDFLMVLGIESPGESGQTMCDDALEAAAVFQSMQSRYGYEMMFDGGVTVQNVSAIPARYIVSASAVLSAPQPAEAAFRIRLASPHTWA